MCQRADPFLSVNRNRGHTIRIEFLAIAHPLHRDVISHVTTAWPAGNVLRELRYERPKKSIEWVEMHVLFFAVCGPKFAKFGRHVGEWLQFSTPFSDRRYLVPVRRYSRSNRKIRNFDVFGPPNFLGEGPPNFWPTFKNYSHHRTCGKVWWRSAQKPPRLGDEKKLRG